VTAGEVFHVRTPAEEFVCPHCAQPVQADRPDPGEPDWSGAFRAADGRAYCSRGCARAEELVPCAGCGEDVTRYELRASPYTGALVCEGCEYDEDEDAARTDPTVYGAGVHWDGDE
jgi:hypothetical protein